MTQRCELYWSFRSPYSYLGAKHYRRLSEEFDLEIDLRPVYPIAIRSPEFFEKSIHCGSPISFGIACGSQSIAEFRFSSRTRTRSS